MRGGMKVGDLARARCPQGGVGWINRESITHQLLSENRIRHAFERINDAGERSAKEKFVSHKPLGFSLDSIR